MQGDSVLVLDSQGQNSLALSRTLGKKGLSVTAGGHTRYLPGMFSKYTDDSYVHPDPAEDRERFVDHLAAHLERNEYAAVFAVTDLSTGVLSAHKERLEATGTRLGVPDREQFLAANDKKRLFERAADLPIPSPETHAPDSMSEVAALDEDRESAVVIKPRRTTVADAAGESHTNRLSGTNYVDADESLVDRFRELVEGNRALEREYPLVQVFVDGVETKCTVGLAEDGDLLASFQHQKSHVYPPSGGVGAIRSGTREPRMLDHAEAVVSALEWTGPVHVEFMETADGEFYLLEVNGRYWGSLALTINSGVDVPWLHYHQLLGLDLPERPPGYRTDVRQRKLFYHDVLWLREHLDRGNYGAIPSFLGAFATTREEFLDPSDPKPLLGLATRSIKAIADSRDGRSIY